MASAASPRPTIPAVTPAINTILGPELDLASWVSGVSSVLDFSVSVGCVVRVVVAKVVGKNVEVSVVLAVGAEVSGRLAELEVSANAVVEDGPASVVNGKEEEVEDSVEAEDVDDGESLETGELMGVDRGAADVGPATGAGSAAAAEISNGGLYSKVLVKSSIIFKPYLSPAGKLLLPTMVFGIFHVKVPVFEIEAFKIKGLGKHDSFYFFSGRKKKKTPIGIKERFFFFWQKSKKQHTSNYFDIEDVRRGSSQELYGDGARCGGLHVIIVRPIAITQRWDHEKSPAYRPLYCERQARIQDTAERKGDGILAICLLCVNGGGGKRKRS